jgi:hypothetical protein
VDFRRDWFHDSRSGFVLDGGEDVSRDWIIGLTKHAKRSGLSELVF